MTGKPSITDHGPKGLEKRFRDLGIEPWRALQVLRWIHRRRAISFEEMTDLPKPLRERLSAKFHVSRTSLADRHASPDGTQKILLKLQDGSVIETVLIPDEVETKTGLRRERRTVCVSTQVGCPMACLFCASGLDGLKRNLTVGEIVEQVFQVQRLLPPGERVNNVVLMGIGEPLINYTEVTGALRLWKAAWGAGIGYNRVTLSTVGLLERLKDLVRDKVTPNLALSLHAPNDEIRAQVIPTMKNVPVAEMIAAGVEYKEVTRKNVTFEYVLLRKINDEPSHARELGHRLEGTKCKVNVIPYNRVPGLPYEEPEKDRIDRFVAELGSCGVPVTVRKRKGDAVSAACGQLRAQFNTRKGAEVVHAS